jgi:hypothetical protein
MCIDTENNWIFLLNILGVFYRQLIEFNKKVPNGATFLLPCKSGWCVHQQPTEQHHHLPSLHVFAPGDESPRALHSSGQCRPSKTTTQVATNRSIMLYNFYTKQLNQALPLAHWQTMLPGGAGHGLTEPAAAAVT